jgi:uncharacterized protein (TIGR02118 family)
LFRITSLHGFPDDPEEFDRYYGSVHTPIVQRIPGVRNIRFGRALATVNGDVPPYYLVSDVYFDDKASFEAALESPQMKQALADVPNFASGGVTIMFCECDDFPPIADSKG